MTHRSHGRWYLRHGPVYCIGHARCIGRLRGVRARRLELRLIGSALVGGVGSGRGPRPARLPAGRPARHRRRHHDARADRDRDQRRRLATGRARSRHLSRWSWRSGSARSCCCCRRSAAWSTSCRRSGRRRCCRRSRPPIRGSSRWPGRACSPASASPAGCDAGTALRPRRLRVGIASAIAFTALAGTAFTGVAIANELALRDRTTPPAVSRFGPTDAEAELAAVRRRPGGRHERPAHRPPPRPDRSAGHRLGRPVRPARRHELPLAGLRRHRPRAGPVRRPPASAGGPGRGRPAAAGPSADAQSVREETLDLQAVRTALARRSRATAEDRGIEVIEGARARRCRVAVDGATFRAAFPQVRWLVGDADLERWRGQLDYWVFVDGQLGPGRGQRQR